MIFLITYSSPTHDVNYYKNQIEKKIFYNSNCIHNNIIYTYMHIARRPIKMTPLKISLIKSSLNKICMVKKCNETPALHYIRGITHKYTT